MTKHDKPAPADAATVSAVAPADTYELDEDTLEAITGGLATHQYLGFPGGEAVEPGHPR